jgi:NADH-quinone oxidoreductase subunit F
VDLRLGVAAPATDEERAAVVSVLGPPETGWDGGQRTAADGHAAYGGRAARAQRHLLLPVLHAVQERIGWISPGSLDYICARLTIPPAEAYGVASFYALFRTTPSPAAVVHVCDDLACQVNGAELLCQEMERRFGAEGTEATSNGTGIARQRSPCLGQCDRGSAAMIQHAGADPARAGMAPFDPAQARGRSRRQSLPRAFPR